MSNKDKTPCWVEVTSIIVGLLVALSLLSLFALVESQLAPTSRSKTISSTPRSSSLTTEKKIAMRRWDVSEWDDDFPAVDHKDTVWDVGGLVYKKWHKMEEEESEEKSDGDENKEVYCCGGVHVLHV